MSELRLLDGLRHCHVIFVDEFPFRDFFLSLRVLHSTHTSVDSSGRLQRSLQT